MNEPATLKKNAVGTAHIVFFVVAAAAPLTAVVGASPAAFAFGNGAGLPGAFLIAGMVYAIFGAAFTAMSRHCGSAGGFYGYVARGLGRPPSVAAAFIAIAAYTAIQVAIYALFGLFATQRLAAFGIDLPWWSVAMGAVFVAHLCGRRGIEFSGAILGILMLLEVLIMLVLDVAILINGPGGGVSLDGFRPAVLFGNGLGVSLVFVVASYVGFEATTIFSEEAKDAGRTVPRATYLAVALITLLYAFSTWTISLDYGTGRIAAAAGADPANLYFVVAQRLLGDFPRIGMESLLITSLFASFLAFHNTITRYLFALARDRLLPSWLGHIDPRFGAPSVAGKVQSALALFFLGVFALFEVDPYAVVFSWLSAFATIGILVVQFMVAVSAWLFFRQDRRDVGFFRRAAAPLISAGGLATWLVLVCLNLPLLSGSEARLIQFFPVIILGIGIAGVLTALRMRQRRPKDYAKLGDALGAIV